jgi:hypothetical protein
MIMMAPMMVVMVTDHPARWRTIRIQDYDRTLNDDYAGSRCTTRRRHHHNAARRFAHLTRLVVNGS